MGVDTPHFARAQKPGNGTKGILTTLKKGPAETNQYQFKYTVHLEYFNNFTLPADSRKLPLCEPIIALSRKQPDSLKKNNNFTFQNTGVAGLQLVSLFVLLCDFSESGFTFYNTKVTQQHK